MRYAVRQDEQEIRAIAADRIIESPARVLAFTPRKEMTDAERWRLLCKHDPHAAAMLRAAFVRLYQLRVPEEHRGPQR